MINLLINFIRKILGKPTPFSIPTDSTLIEDKMPASQLLGHDKSSVVETLNAGDIAVPLAKKVYLRFHLIPNSHLITGIRLRFGTYCRINQGRIFIQFPSFTHSINTNSLVDNQWSEIIFPKAIRVASGQPLTIQIYAETTDDNNQVALWCSSLQQPFFHLLPQKLLEFPVVNPPKVSIVIPVFNQVLHTYNCLLTLQAYDPAISKEVIIVDNASTDKTSHLLKKLRGAIKIVHNQQNQGYVEACRQGAHIAQGEYIVFLNNDTQVTPGWLSEPIELMETDKQIGIIGAKLIYPNGQLQEAGGIIFQDASGWNYGRFQDPNDPRFNQNRLVDYCSGACLMIRKLLWEQLGGFDLRYAPAYYEDTDLCFAARQAGYQVYYCHQAQVIHHEGVTAGTDILSGYKAYQAINQKKFQAKWWDVLTTHPAPPPQSSPDAAAFRFTTLQSPNAHGGQKYFSFRIPPHKIIATHLLAQGWATNFWSYLNIRKVDKELDTIQSLGFNTIILLVPWVGFQTKVDPITYHEEYLILFKQLIEKIQQHKMYVILRLGYAHDNGPLSEPEGFLRQVVIGADPVMLTAWCDYLSRIWDIVKYYFDILLGGFISWEDFFFLDLTHLSLEQRLLFAQRTGYQEYLTQYHSLEEINAGYQQTFSTYTQVPIPAFQSSAIGFFSQFWDKVLIETIFQQSKKYFPPLTMEIRTDCDQQVETHICHYNTFDVSYDTHISMIYYSPAWGSPNQGESEPAANILQRLQFMLAQTRHHTNNVIFIDQFNFIDNTPGFEQNTGILPAEIPEFLTQAGKILAKQTVGYGLWTLQDVRANVLKNGLFQRNYPSWEITEGEIVSLVAEEKQATWLNPGGTLQQTLTHCVGVSLDPEKLFQLDFEVKASHTIELVVIIYDEQQNIRFEKQISCQGRQWQAIHLENVPFWLGNQLVFKNQSQSPILLTEFYLYQQCQENGIFDIKGNPKWFYQSFVSLNQQLSQLQQTSLNSYFSVTDLKNQPEHLTGLFTDQWMGKMIVGVIAIPRDSLSFIIKVYVPESWTHYHNQLSLFLHDQWYPSSPLLPVGYHEIEITVRKELIQSDFDSELNQVIFFQLAAEKTYSPSQFEPDSIDTREVSCQLLELGFINQQNT